MVDGTEAMTLRDILETEIAYIEERHKRGIAFFRKAGGFAPTMGILGTVLGLVHTLGNTGDASRMATAISLGVYRHALGSRSGQPLFPAGG